MALLLRPDWYVREFGPSIDLNAAGIYEWRLDGIGVYVGKALRLSSRINAYPNNVRRMLEGLPWHGNPNRQYRLIHQALRDAYDAASPVSVVVLENCAKDERRLREDFWIAQRRREHAQGGPRVLNA